MKRPLKSISHNWDLPELWVKGNEHFKFKVLFRKAYVYILIYYELLVRIDYSLDVGNGCKFWWLWYFHKRRDLKLDRYGIRRKVTIKPVLSELLFSGHPLLRGHLPKSRKSFPSITEKLTCITVKLGKLWTHTAGPNHPTKGLSKRDNFH